MIVIGLMSGTSADGVDVALCDITGKPGAMTAKIISAKTYAYSPEMRNRILNACDRNQSRVDEITRLNVDISNTFVDAMLDLLTQSNLTFADVDLIGSHGQTLWHDVLDDGRVGATFQIGEGAVIAERTGITTINNLRARDVAAGGQGAPLTGYVDWLLLRHPSAWRAVQNIGGMGNVTFLPPLSDHESVPISFDTGPGNALIDVAVMHYSNGEETYDRDGTRARRGKIDEVWLDELLQHPYYSRQYPKTTGRELFGTEESLRLIKLANARNLSGDDVIATLTALTAASIADAYQRFAPEPVQDVILGGGGRHNPALVTMLKELVTPADVLTHEDIGLDSDFKEALVFAILAYETWNGRVATIPSLTGARHASVLGQIIPGANWRGLR